MYKRQVLSCSDDSVEDKDIQKIDPVGQLEVYKTSREKEILVKFIRTNYVKDIQIEIAYRNTESGENGEWTTIVLNGDNYKYGGNYLLQVPAEGTYEVAITLIGANELRSESKSQLASTFEYVKTSMFDCAHSMICLLYTSTMEAAVKTTVKLLTFCDLKNSEKPTPMFMTAQDITMFTAP